MVSKVRVIFYPIGKSKARDVWQETFHHKYTPQYGASKRADDAIGRRSGGIV
jgi:hypothetical protein